MSENTYTEVGKNVMLGHLATLATRVRLLDDNMDAIPDWSTAAQLKAITWGVAASGELPMIGEINFEIPAGTTVAAASYTSVDGTIEYNRKVIAIASRETFTNDGLSILKEAVLDLNLGM